jgi:hypothetical protein
MKMNKTGEKYLIFHKIEENGTILQKWIQQLYGLGIQEELNFM